MPIESCQQNGVWVDGDPATNPTDETVLATTGALVGGDYLFSFIIRSTVDTSVNLCKRNATDDADVNSLEIPIIKDQANQIVFATKIKIFRDEILVVRQEGNLTGEIEASIFYAKIVG